jgi:hypothetical protein
MAALTAQRAASMRTINFDKRPMAAAVKAYKGGLAACKAGFFGPATGDAAEIVVGRFYDTVDNLSGAAGDKKVEIQFFRERTLFLLDNDSGAPVVAASRESACSFLDDHTATLLDAGKGVGGIVYDVDTDGVWVELPFPASPDDAGTPRLQAGTTTLVAGTKSITGVVLTASSRILLTMKDPGAGAITGMSALDAPAASRNVGAGSFVINAIDDSKAVINTAVCTVDYLVIG